MELLERPPTIPERQQRIREAVEANVAAANAEAESQRIREEEERKRRRSCGRFGCFSVKSRQKPTPTNPA